MAATVEMWEDSEGRWWWSYIDGDLRIDANHPYDSRAAAEQGAAVAYPDVPVGRAARASREREGRVGAAACLLMTIAIWRHYRPGRG